MSSLLPWRRRPANTSIETLLAPLEIAGIPASVRWRLRLLITDGAPHELHRANPNYLADRLQLDTHTALETLAHAVVAGLFVLNWELTCVSCGNTWCAFPSLRHGHLENVCPACGTRFDAQVDQNVQVTFSVHPRARTLPEPVDDPQFRANIDQRYGAVSGLTLLHIPAFRSLFRDETLPPGESLQVTRLTLLFTDLGGSTALYARRGDPRAYRLVRAHFDTLFGIVEAQYGSVVKTIGDAVMATFVAPERAVQAALDMHRALVDLNRQQQVPDPDRLRLKVGLHAGPCLVVTLNDRLDYFGTTVNLAARIQSLARDDEIALSQSLAEEAPVSPLLTAIPLEALLASVRGIREPVSVRRFRAPI